MKSVRLFTPAAVLALIALPVFAAGGAPDQLRDKTVTLSWTTSGRARCADGSDKNYSNSNSRVIYVSTAGRPFLRATLRDRKDSRSGELGPGDRGPASVRFEGGKLVGVETFSSGARQFIATFDTGYSSCTLSIIDGRAGNTTIRRRSPAGVMCDVDNVANTGPSCSVQTGNAFAGQ